MNQFNNDSVLLLEQFGDLLIREAIAGNLRAVRELIAQGADVNSANHKGFTPLMGAAQWRHEGVVRFLLEHGANVHTLEEYEGRNALMYASISGSPKCVQLLLEAGNDVNMKDKYGMTALMMAATTGEMEIVRHLVNGGADINSIDERGLTATDWASKWGRTSIVGFLSSTDTPEYEIGPTRMH
jgi:ankyrin repeat protein